MTSHSDDSLVLTLLSEGGGADFFRRADAAGGWLFYRSVGHGGFEDVIPEEVLYRRAGSSPRLFPSLQAAIDDLAPDDSWLWLGPRRVHPEVQPDLAAMLQAAVSRIDQQRQTVPERTIRSWQRACAIRPGR